MIFARQALLTTFAAPLTSGQNSVIVPTMERAITPEKREELYAGWREAIERSVGWRKQA